MIKSLLLICLISLAVYVATLDGAAEGFKKYLVPDFSKVLNPDLLVKAMGQGFFSLSVGIGSILIYGSYMNSKANMVKIGFLVTLADVGIAFLAGLLIIPAMFVAQENGIEIFKTQEVIIDGITTLQKTDHIIDSKGMVFNVLPELFNTMGTSGIFVSIIFFFLMTIAALTSSIALLEGLVAFGVDNQNMTRKTSTFRYGFFSLLLSIVIIFNFKSLFGLAIVVVNDYSLPLLAAVFCVFVGWLVNRNALLEEIRNGYPNVENSFFFKLWPIFLRYICPTLIIAVFLNQILKT